MTDKFAPTARAMAEVCGIPDYPFAVVPHPIANNTDEQLRAKAEEAVRQSVTILTRRAAVGARPVEAL
jgi:hypothetical protein